MICCRRRFFDFVSVSWHKCSRRPRYGWLGNPVERIGHRANELDDTFATRRRYRMKLQAALRSKRAQFFQMIVIRSGIQLGRYHNHWLSCQIRAERSEFVLDDFKIPHWIAVVAVARIHQVRDQPRPLDMF